MNHPLCPDRSKIPGVHTVPVRLSDGKLWGLAMATLMLRPITVPNVNPTDEPSIDVHAYEGFPTRTEEHLQPLRREADENPGNISYKTIFEAAAALLMQAHTISLEDALTLLKVEAASLHEIVQAVALAINPPPVEDSESASAVDNPSNEVHVGPVS